MLALGPWFPTLAHMLHATVHAIFVDPSQVQKIILVDNDIYVASNLTRQCLGNKEDVGHWDTQMLLHCPVRLSFSVDVSLVLVLEHISRTSLYNLFFLPRCRLRCKLPWCHLTCKSR